MVVLRSFVSLCGTHKLLVIHLCTVKLPVVVALQSIATSSECIQLWSGSGTKSAKQYVHEYVLKCPAPASFFFLQNVKYAYNNTCTDS